MPTFGLTRNVLRRDSPARDKVSFVELFFDLVFVFAITELSHSLVHAIEKEHAVDGLLQLGIMLFAVWWVWVYTTWATNWLDPDAGPVRWMLVALMLLGLLMSTSIPEAFGERGLIFASAYVVMQLGRSIFLIVAMHRHNRVGAINLFRLTIWFVVSAVPWILGGLAEDPQQRMILWPSPC